MLILSIFIVVMMIVGILIGVLAVTVSLADFNTDGEQQEGRGFTGTVTLTDTTFATSWMSGGQSEDITAVLSYQQTEHTLDDPKGYRLKAYVEGSLIKQWPTDGSYHIRSMPSGTYEHISLPPWVFSFEGPIVGRLQVQMEFKIGGIFGGVYERDLGWDGAYLESGEGEVFVDGTQRTFEEGDSVSVTVKTGFTGGEGWVLKLYPPTTRTSLFEPRTLATLSDDRVESFTILIEDGWFQPGDVIDSTFRIELWNHLFNVGFDEFFSVDLISRIPSKPILDVETTDVTVSITMLTERTYSDVKGFKIWAWYGTASKPAFADGESWIVLGDEINTGLTGFYSFDIKNKDGNIVIQVIAVDVDGRASQPAFHHVIVEDKEISGDGDGIEAEFNIIIFLVFIGIGILVLIFLSTKAVPGDPMIKILFGIMFLAIFGLIGFIASGGMA